MCYLTWCTVLAETTLGRDMGLVWVLFLRQLGKVITALMNNLPKFV